MTDLKTYTLQYKYGIDDLLGLSAYVGSWGQGDHYSSNDPSENHPSYVSYQFGDVPQTKEAIDAELIRRQEENEKYIAELKAFGKYGTTYDVSVTFKTHPLFDEPNVPEKPLMSSSFFFLNPKNDK